MHYVPKNYPFFIQNEQKVFFLENLENAKGRGKFREICENFLESGGTNPIIRKFGRLPNDSGDLATLFLY